LGLARQQVLTYIARKKKEKSSRLYKSRSQGRPLFSFSVIHGADKSFEFHASAT
jgi:hypothetical protein